jgi:signal transduction histidine kinase
MPLLASVRAGGYEGGSGDAASHPRGSESETEFPVARPWLKGFSRPDGLTSRNGARRPERAGHAIDEIGLSTSFPNPTVQSQADQSHWDSLTIARTLDAVARERQRIVRDLHDHAGQYFVGIKLRLAALELRATEQPLCDALRELQATVTRFNDELSAICAGQRCGVPRGHSLVATLETLIPQWASEVGIAARFKPGPTNLDDIDDATAEVVFRVVQEALTNVAKHAAQASRVSVRLWLESQMLKLEIEDDGLAACTRPIVSPRSARRCRGIIGMRERVAELGGQFAVRHLTGRGTRVVATFPVDEPISDRFGGI